MVGKKYRCKYCGWASDDRWKMVLYHLTNHSDFYEDLTELGILEEVK